MKNGTSKTQRRRPSRWTIAIALTAMLLGAHCTGAQDVAPSGGETSKTGATESLPPSHTKMLALLAEVAERTETEHPLLSESRARDLRKQLEALPENAHPRNRVRLLLALGEEDLRQNRLEEGIGHLEEAYNAVETFLEQGVAAPVAVYSTAYRLGVGYMRLGETRNCCLRHSPESCILPIRGGGVHNDPEGSRKAIARFKRVLELSPPGSEIHLKAKWLINLAAMTLDEYPQAVPERWRIPESAYRSDTDVPHFRNRAPELGLATFDLAGGAIAEDFDGDGWLDLFVSTYDPTETPRLFRNDGRGGFEDRTAEANLKGLFGGFNLVHADYDNDGDADVLVLRGAWLGPTGRIPNSLLRNDGKGRFVDVTFDAGLGEVHYATQTAGWADYDNDGDLDLYVGNEAGAERSSPCQLFRNNGDGTFIDVAAAAGVTNDRFAKSVAWGDYDDDGDADLYVSNLGQPNRLYRNEGSGTFVDVAGKLGVEGPIRSFAAWFWDYDNDGKLDLHVASYEWNEGGLAAVVRSTLGLPHTFETTALYRGDGKGGFTNVGRAAGLDPLSLPMGANFGDLDGNGWLDVYLGTGYPDYEALTPNVMYLNDSGKTFVDVTHSAGLGHLQKGHGVVFADLDHDGDLDLFEQVGGFFFGDKFSNVLFENPGFGHRFLALELEGREANRSAIGARIRVEAVEGGKAQNIFRTVGPGGSFGSNPLRQTIGLGNAEAVTRVEIRWPGSGTVQTIESPPLNKLLRVVEGDDEVGERDLEPVNFGAD